MNDIFIIPLSSNDRLCIISIEDAALAYNKKAVELFGEHAYLNVILP